MDWSKRMDEIMGYLSLDMFPHTIITLKTAKQQLICSRIRGGQIDP